MAVTLLTWNGKSVGISAKAIQMLTELTITSSRRTAESDQGGVHKAQDDGLEPAQFMLTIGLDARLGVDVYSELQTWISYHRKNALSKVLIAGRDLFGAVFMISDITTANTRLNGAGVWVHTDITLTFKEAVAGTAESRGGSSASTASSSSGSSSSKGSSSRTTSGSSDSGSNGSGNSSGGDRNLTGAVGGYTPGTYSAAATNAIAAVSANAKSVAPAASGIRESTTSIISA